LAALATLLAEQLAPVGAAGVDGLHHQGEQRVEFPTGLLPVVSADLLEALQDVHRNLVYLGETLVVHALVLAHPLDLAHSLQVVLEEFFAFVLADFFQSLQGGEPLKETDLLP